MMPLDYDYLRKLLKERSGLDLSVDKQYLVESRLLPLARRLGLAGLPELVQKLKGNAEAIIADVVEAMTTNETFFFRDKLPFDHLTEEMLPALLEARAARRSLRIWCAASSTGQEPYSIAMCLKEAGAALNGWRVEIVATDLSQAVLEKSKSGLFSQFEVQRGLPINLLMKYFKQVGDIWEISPELRAMVQHRQLNLLQDFSQLGTFDLIFCRNVLIYFDQRTKSAIFNRLAQRLESDGYLALGAAETVVGLTDAFKPHASRRGIYRPNLVRAPALVPVMRPALQLAARAG
ncbi:MULTISPECIES: protein-glutamate O-methyltransferase CheR [Rhodopseudomonas]|uniref:protein-glutamate O-methyltransferase n=1 Tax=Rhodopseudomonas palustris TaxID=1076 RepID=A0A0D7EFY6_RHOPL|nr:MULTISPECIES: protein-glutamate O-methyltransferase CheR [Rhodopseudomonas]KIZ39694.1 chemotaxis protein CheR [Rhodopseudomonas palustris]MDF3813163.1 protein-glutamate O-methyltransferase CheR [Rhodopseudomonas sp. BAL398]WOK17876.1 protein-glutamate O-methyltransferase CheR [Rhodopseudomonas sp. BAL398]